MKSESDFKSALVKEIKRDGHYARRLEDQYAVGLPDMVVVARSLGTVFVEAKLVRYGKFQLSPRQYVECRRIIDSGGRAVALGIDSLTRSYYLGEPQYAPLGVAECTQRRVDERFVEFLERYYHVRRP